MPHLQELKLSVQKEKYLLKQEIAFVIQVIQTSVSISSYLYLI